MFVWLYIHLLVCLYMHFGLSLFDCIYIWSGFVSLYIFGFKFVCLLCILAYVYLTFNLEDVFISRSSVTRFFFNLCPVISRHCYTGAQWVMSQLQVFVYLHTVNIMSLTFAHKWYVSVCLLTDGMPLSVCSQIALYSVCLLTDNIIFSVCLLTDDIIFSVCLLTDGIIFSVQQYVR